MYVDKGISLHFFFPHYITSLVFRILSLRIIYSTIEMCELSSKRSLLSAKSPKRSAHL